MVSGHFVHYLLIVFGLTAILVFYCKDQIKHRTLFKALSLIVLFLFISHAPLTHFHSDHFSGNFMSHDCCLTQVSTPAITFEIPEFHLPAVCTSQPAAQNLEFKSYFIFQNKSPPV